MREHLDLQQITQPQPGTTDLPPAVPPKMHQVSPSLTTNLANQPPMQNLSAQASMTKQNLSNQVPMTNQYTAHSVLNTQVSAPSAAQSSAQLPTHTTALSSAQTSAHASVQSSSPASTQTSTQNYIAQQAAASQRATQIMHSQQQPHAAHNPYSASTGGQGHLAQNHQASFMANSTSVHSQNMTLPRNNSAAMSNHNVIDNGAAATSVALSSALQAISPTASNAVSSVSSDANTVHASTTSTIAANTVHASAPRAVGTNTVHPSAINAANPQASTEANLNLASTLAPNVTADTLGNYAPSTGYSSLNCGTAQLAHTQLGSLARTNTTSLPSPQPINLQAQSSLQPNLHAQQSNLQPTSANISSTAQVASPAVATQVGAPSVANQVSSPSVIAQVTTTSVSAPNATQGLHNRVQGDFQTIAQGTIQTESYNATPSQIISQNTAQNPAFTASSNDSSATFAVNNPSYQGLSTASSTLTQATQIASMHDWSQQSPEYVNGSKTVFASASTTQAQQPTYTYVPDALNAHLNSAAANVMSTESRTADTTSSSTAFLNKEQPVSNKTSEQGVHLDMFDEGMPKAPPRTTMNLTPSSQGLSFLREQGVDVSASSKKKNSSPQSAFDTLLKLLGDKANMDNTDFKVSYQDYWIMRRNENRIVQQEVKQSQEQYFKDYMQQVRSANTFNTNYTFEKLNCDQLNLNAFMFAKQFADEMAVSLQPNLLLILGNPGTGKTALCHAIAQRYISNKATPEHCTMRRPDLPMVLFSSFSDIVNLKMFTFNESPEERDIREKRFEEICNADMLIIDDIAPEREELSQFAQKILAEIMSVRCDSKLPLVLATPLNNLEIANKVGVRCFERINSFFVVATCLEGNSRRPRAIRLRKWPGLQDNVN